MACLHAPPPMFAITSCLLGSQRRLAFRGCASVCRCITLRVIDAGCYCVLGVGLRVTIIRVPRAVHGSLVRVPARHRQQGTVCPSVRACVRACGCAILGRCCHARSLSRARARNLLCTGQLVGSTARFQVTRAPRLHARVLNMCLALYTIYYTRSAGHGVLRDPSRSRASKSHTHHNIAPLV